MFRVSRCRYNEIQEDCRISHRVVKTVLKGLVFKALLRVLLLHLGIQHDKDREPAMELPRNQQEQHPTAQLPNNPKT